MISPKPKIKVPSETSNTIGPMANRLEDQETSEGEFIPDQPFGGTVPYFPLADTVDGQFFTDGTATYPTTWTETTAPSDTDTDSHAGLWFIDSVPANLAWEYRKQTSLDTSVTNQWSNFVYGPIYFRGGLNLLATNVTTTFAMHRDNSGFDANTYLKAQLIWNSATPEFEIRGIDEDGTTLTVGTSYSVPAFPLNQPIYFRLVYRKESSTTRIRVYAGTNPIPSASSLIHQTVWPSSINGGDVWASISMSRAASGVANHRVFIGQFDVNTVWA